MKFLLLFVFIGVATASPYVALDRAANEAVHAFNVGMEKAPSLKSVLYLAEKDARDATEDDIKTELGKHLNKRLEELLTKVKEALERGEDMGQEIFDKMIEIHEKLKEINVEVGKKAKDLEEQIKKKTMEIVMELLDLEDEETSAYRTDVAFTETNIRELLRELKKHILTKVDAEFLKEKIMKLFGQLTELVHQLLKTLREKGRHKLEILIDRLLGEDEDKRSLSDLWEKVKDYFKDLKIDLKEKFLRFGQWMKEIFDKGIATSKDKMENIKVLGKQFLKHAKGISAEIASEALEFFRQYKEELGDIWEEIKDTVKETMDKNKDKEIFF